MSASTSGSDAAAEVKLLQTVFSQPTVEAARQFLTAGSKGKGKKRKGCSASDLRRLARLAGLGQAWVDCDQTIPGNVQDLADSLVAELYEPFHFFRASLRGRGKDDDRSARALFSRKRCTGPLEKSARHRFWAAAAGLAPCPWLPGPERTFDAVCHVVQSGSGTGVHVGGGRVLTCAHVVDARDDDDEEKQEEDDDGEGAAPPRRIGRRKVVMFPSGRTFLAECASTVETADGAADVAVMVLLLEVPGLPPLPSEGPPRGWRSKKEAAVIVVGDNDDDEEDEEEGEGGEEDGGDGGGGGGECEEIEVIEILDDDDEGSSAHSSSSSPPPSSFLGVPSAAVAETPVPAGGRLFCVGNPSNVDLESLRPGNRSTEFAPPTWHASHGKCVAHTSAATERERAAQAARGRAPTRGEKRKLEALEARDSSSSRSNKEDDDDDDDDDVVALQHSCWTYWGHSGAPLFDEAGRVVGLHSSWDDRSGARIGQKLSHLRMALRKEREGQREG